MIEVMILFCGMVVAYCVGNVMGYQSGRKYGAARERFNILMEPVNRARADRRAHEELVDHLSRQSLAFSQKQKHWIKVYDADTE